MEDNTQTTLRDVISASFDAVEGGETSTPVEQSAKSEDRPRDESGKFAKVEQPKEEPQAKQPEPEVKPEPPQQEQTSSTPQRPSTWKKDYLPIWDKISQGIPLTAEESTKLAAYTQQRETEYKTGVSTYKAEAEKAKELQAAIAPFIPTLQQHNIQPTQWIQNLGRAHQTLALGTPEQKIQMFTQLAQDYGIPLNMIGNAAQGQPQDQTVIQLMQEIQNLKSQVGNVSSWREQQEQMQIQHEMSKMEDAEKYPYFQMVRGTMAQFLESGQAADLETAYSMAVEPIEAIIQERIAQSAPQSHQSAQQVVAKAKAAAVSPKSANPVGKVASTTDAKDRRAVLAEQVESMLGGGRL